MTQPDIDDVVVRIKRGNPSAACVLGRQTETSLKSSDLQPTHDTMANSLLLERLRAEFLEMPGLRLKPEQVQRLCGIEPSVCQSLLDALVEATFLWTTPDGHYMRSTTGDTRHSRVAKPSLKGDNPLLKAS
jgi:hypothetical protein